jgi:hypothetical protein
VSDLQEELGLSALLKGTSTDFHLVSSRIQTSNLSVTVPTLLTARLPATHELLLALVVTLNSSGNLGTWKRLILTSTLVTVVPNSKSGLECHPSIHAPFSGQTEPNIVSEGLGESALGSDAIVRRTWRAVLSFTGPHLLLLGHWRTSQRSSWVDHLVCGVISGDGRGGTISLRSLSSSEDEPEW